MWAGVRRLAREIGLSARLLVMLLLFLTEEATLLPVLLVSLLAARHGMGMIPMEYAVEYGRRGEPLFVMAGLPCYVEIIEFSEEIESSSICGEEPDGIVVFLFEAVCAFDVVRSDDLD